MKKDYLPSRQFRIKLAILVGFVLVAFFLYWLIPQLINVTKNIIAKSAENKLLVKELVAKDSNGNGIADWEETLWGLDPTKNGDSNKEYILKRKAEIAKTDAANGIDPSAPLTENDKLARELLSTIVSLENSGDLNDVAIANIGTAVGKKITLDLIPDIYNKNSLSVVGVSQVELVSYWVNLKKINDKYQNKDIGNELTIIAQALNDKDPQALKSAIGIADSYRSFGKDMMGIPVPKSIVDTHISMANNYEKTAKALDSMSSLLDDPMSGIKSILQYKKYNDAILKNISDLNDFFVKNGILTNSQ